MHLTDFNTFYLTDSYIVFTLKMESVTKNTIFGLKMKVKSGLEKIILKSLHAGTYSRVWNKRSPLNKHSPMENLAKRISVAPFFTLCYGVRNKAVAPG